MERKQMCKTHKYQAFNVICKECRPIQIRDKCCRMALREAEEKLKNERGKK